MILTPETDLLAEYGVQPRHVLGVPDARRCVRMAFDEFPWDWYVYLTAAQAAELERDGAVLVRLLTCGFTAHPVMAYITQASAIMGDPPIVPFDVMQPVVWAETVPMVVRLTGRGWERE